MIETKEFTVSSEKGTTAVIGSGELDLTRADQLSNVLQDALLTGQRIVIDFRDATFIDTAILAVLARCGRKVLESDDRLKIIVTAGSHPDYVLKTVGFREIMDIDTDSSGSRPRSGGTSH